jgi:hypothetical protein
MLYTCYDKIHTVPGIGRAPPGLPGITKTGPKGLLVGSTALGPITTTPHLQIRSEALTSITMFWEEHERLAKRKEWPQTEGMFGIPCLGIAILAKDLPRSATFAFRRSIRSGPRTLADTSNIAKIPSLYSDLLRQRLCPAKLDLSGG